jgi:hypothetical protein
VSPPGPGEDVEGGTRRAGALRVVAAAERAAGTHRLPRPSRFVVAGDAARRLGADLDAVPTGAREFVSVPVDAHATRATARAALVRFGKFDRAGSIRARAYLPDGTTLKVQTADADDRRGIANEIGARRRIAGLAPGLAPDVHRTGHLRRYGVYWIHEEVVHGRHPAGPADVSASADAVVGALARLYAAAGYATEGLAAALGHDVRERFLTTVACEPHLERFVPHVERLLADARDLDVSFAHGDLVGSNVFVEASGRVRLVDWEYARRLPVAHDAASLLTQALDKPGAIAVIERHLGDRVGVGPSTYTLRDQLILAQVRMLGWYEARRRRAAEAGRLGALARDTTRRVRSLEALLEV